MAPKIGDVFGITCRAGTAYFQYTHHHSQFGALIRVVSNQYLVEPADVCGLTEGRPSFITFFPLRMASKMGLVRWVRRCSVSKINETFPLFRDGVPHPVTGKVDLWWLWDGSREWEYGSWNDELAAYPIRETINDTLLRRRIETEWLSAGER